MSQNHQQEVISVMVALYNFNAEDQPELGIKKGEVLDILDMDPALNGWAYAKRKRDGTEGYVPISYVGSPEHNGNNNNNRGSPPQHNHNNNQRNRPNGNNGLSNFNRNQFNNTNNYRNGNKQSSMTSLQHPSQHQNENSNGNAMRNGQNVQGNTIMNEPSDPKQIICSFHRDFIPEMDDLYKYFGQFGKITNKLEIEYDNKKVPLAKVKYQNAMCVNKVCDRGNRQQIPSGQQNGTIHIRVYRSMKDYVNGTTRQNKHHRQQYNNNNNNNNKNNNNNNNNGGQRGNNNGGQRRGF